MTRKSSKILILTLGVAMLFGVSKTNAQCAGSPLISPMNQNNGQDGIMFNITALQNVTIDSFWSNFDPGNIPEIEIWHHTGGIVGNQNAAAGWTLVGNALSVTSNGNNILTPVPIYINVPILNGNTEAFYLTTTSAGGSMNYTNGVGTAGNLFNANASIQLSQGFGKDYPFAATFNPRQFNGHIFYSCCPTPPAPQGPISGDTVLCIGDTVTFSVPWDTIAVAYEWEVPNGDTIISGQGDSTIQMIVGPNSVGGSICVALEDTCTVGPQICIAYSITNPPAPANISGPNSVCQGNTAWYSIPNDPNIISYTWLTPGGSTIITNPDSHAVNVQFGSSGGNVCVFVTDDCASSDTTCLSVSINPNPTLANAGPDRNVCAGRPANLAATPTAQGIGTWSIVSAPANGVFSDTNDNQASYLTNAPGVHTLRWTVSSSGCPSSSDIMEVTVIATPTAYFSADNECEGTPMAFTDLSSSNGTNITSWLWDVTGNGVDNYANQNPVHNYSAPGTYNVRLIVSAQGCADTMFQNVSVYPNPVLNISATDRCFGDLIQLDNNSTISAGTIDSVSWNFGDGTGVFSSQTPNSDLEPTHFYNQSGNYTITHSAASNQGCVITAQIPITVFELPVAKFNAINACQFQYAEFVDESTVGGGALIDKWAWDFGDGSDSSHLQDPTHYYDVSGFVPVSLIVKSDKGCISDTLVNLEIFPTPETEFNFQNKVCLGEVLELTNQSSIAYGSIDQYTWTVADSFQYTGETASHLFDEIGVYNVSLTTESNEGCKHTLEKTVPVYEVPEAVFMASDNCEQGKIEFRDSTVFKGDIAVYEWNFDDGSPLIYDRNPTHIFDTFGVYNVKLRVESPQGCIDSVINPLKVFERVNPSFTALPDSGCSPLAVVFEDNTISHTGRDLEYIWYYGNGKSRIDTAEYVYVNTSGKPKYFSVTLEILSDEGCLGSTTIDSLVYVLPQPIAAFESSPELESIKTTNPLVQFKNTSNQENWLRWDFGDGSTSKEHNPSHQFGFEGEYVVELVARNVYQCTDTTRKTAIVTHVNMPFIPAAFTPNGDGLNDFFEIQGLQDVTDVRMTIFDRWGQVIFDGQGKDAKWNGFTDQKKLAQQGVFTYKISFKDKFGEEFEFHGKVSVIGLDH